MIELDLEIDTDVVSLRLNESEGDSVRERDGEFDKESVSDTDRLVDSDDDKLVLNVLDREGLLDAVAESEGDSDLDSEFVRLRVCVRDAEGVGVGAGVTVEVADVDHEGLRVDDSEWEFVRERDVDSLFVRDTETEGESEGLREGVDDGVLVPDGERDTESVTLHERDGVSEPDVLSVSDVRVID